MRNSYPFNPPVPEFPENTIILYDGTMLPCFPKTKPEETKSFEQRTKEEEEGRAFFLRHAFFFLDHAKEILADSRMFLAPVPISNHLAYMGNAGLANPTLGVYLEWWLSNRHSFMQDERGNEALTYCFGGSPLSGMNYCARLYPDGHTETYTERPFDHVWKSFSEINIRYRDTKAKYQAYNLQTVYEILKTYDS